MQKKSLILKLLLFIIMFLPVKGIFAYQKVSTSEYKEFLRKFIEEKYYINKDDDSKVCEIGKVYEECKGVTVSSTGKTYDLETYVAGVLYAEFSGTIDNEEVGKAAAIAIRSYTLNHTNNCSNSIGSSSMEQNFSTGSGEVNIEKYKKYADDTAGIVMTEDDDSIVSGVYSLATTSDCISVDGGKCKFKRCTRFADKIDSCNAKVTEFIVPNGTITYTNHDIHYGGMEPYIAKYLGEQENYKYDEIIKAFYGDVKLSKLSGTTGVMNSNNTNAVCNDETGDMSSVDGVSFPVKNYDNLNGNTSISELENNPYFANAGSNISQCPWYAKARAIEIINTSNLDDDLKEKATAVLKQTIGNGVDWYGGVNSTLGSFFAYSSDINKPMAGSIIAWSGGNGHNYGHVGIIEKVNSDGTVVLSEGWNRGGPDGNDTWSNIAVQTVTLNISDLQYYTSHTFEGYTYLFSYRK